MCNTADGTAEPFLEAHAVPKIHEGVPRSALGPLWLLRTDLPSGTLRRNNRLVGQLVHGRQEQGWLREPVAPGPEDAAEPESREESCAEEGLPGADEEERQD